MKTKITIFFILMFAVFSYAQQGINYKAIIKDGSGNVVANSLIQVQFTILQDVTTVYQETHIPTTDANGIIILNIGIGTPISGVFTDIDWAIANHFLNVQINTGGGLVDLGTTQFMVVPYALNAATANNAATKIDELSDGKSDGSSVFLGQDAGLNDDGSNNRNVGIGLNALSSNTTGSSNVANGYQALYSNTTGFNSVANGMNALYSNTTGYFNTAHGVSSLEMNTEGFQNVANGTKSLNFNTTGSNNTADGHQALYNNLTGNHNSAIGFQSLLSNKTGQYNTAIGSSALFNNTTGRGNVAIGYQAGFWAASTSWNKLYIANSGSIANTLIYGEFDTKKIGFGTVTPDVKLHIVGGTDASLSNGTGYFILGDIIGTNMVIDNNEIIARNNGAASTLYLQKDGGDLSVGGTIVHSSDRRLKRDIEDLDYGLSEILKLTPKQYYWKNRENQQVKSIGLIAQEVQPIIRNIVHTADDKDQTLSVSYTELIPILIKALQEQQDIIDSQNLNAQNQELKIESLSAEIKANNERLETIEKLLNTSQQ